MTWKGLSTWPADRMGIDERGRPSNVDAERLVPGSVLLDDEFPDTVRPTATVDDFSLEKHRRIWLSCLFYYGGGGGS